MQRRHARRAGRARPATGFVSQPEPRTIGRYARGRQLVAGNILFAGHLVEAEGRSLFDIPPPDAAFAEEAHGFAWLDDLAAAGDRRARVVAQAWVSDWIERFGRGGGPGWVPHLAGRRLIRWINHALFLLRGQDRAWSDAFFRSLGRQLLFTSGTWRTAPPGLPRFEALAGCIYGGLSLKGLGGHAAPAVAALAQDCETRIDASGGVAGRSPEDLLEVFTLLLWSAEALQASGRPVPRQIRDAVARVAPALRALRHADGALARFHGGGRGAEGRLDLALAVSRVRTRPRPGARHMGYARLAAGRTTLIADAAAPPAGAASTGAHASTLAFELTSGRRPVIVNCGAGATFGAAWRRAGRATASHSVLGIEGISSSRLAEPRKADIPGRERLDDRPQSVICEWSRLSDGQRLEMAHDGYRPTHGLTHARILDLARDGRSLAGEDLLTTLSDADRPQFDAALDLSNLQGIPFAVRFHLHPDVDASIDMGGAAVSLALKSGEIWVMRHDAAAELSLEPSVYLEKGRLRPRPARQVVLSGRALSYATRIRWSLSKAHETPRAVRDLAHDDPLTEQEEDLTP